jgi:hypothetical protein
MSNTKMNNTKVGDAKAATTSPAVRWALILMLAVLAFFATYRYATARGSATPSGATSEAVAGAAPSAGVSGSGTAGQATGAGGCCGGASTSAGAKTTKPAKLAGNVQKITVDTSKGYYDPSTIELKAGVPAEITFTQSSGCLSQVQSSDLNFFEDLTGGPKTIKLGALAAGTYQFSCGMQMQFGTIVVK